MERAGHTSACLGSNVAHCGDLQVAYVLLDASALFICVSSSRSLFTIEAHSGSQMHRSGSRSIVREPAGGLVFQVRFLEPSSLSFRNGFQFLAHLLQ